MTDTNKLKTYLSDVLHEAVLLSELIQAIDFLENEGKHAVGKGALICIAVERAAKLQSGLDFIKLPGVDA